MNSYNFICAALFVINFCFFTNGQIDTTMDRSLFYFKKDYSLTKPYSGSWDFSGNTIITGEYVRLTSGQKSQYGCIWSSIPVYMRSWEVHMHFRISGTTGSLFGDGIAFWYVDPSTQWTGPVFGVQNYFRGLVVLMDTYSNHNGPHAHDHPYVSAMINNGSISYDHDRDGTHTQLAGCSSRLRNRDHDTLIAISYNGHTLTVSTDVDNKGTWEQCFRVEGVRLPTNYIFGVSAMTGDLVDIHDVLSVKVYELEAGPPMLGLDYNKIEPSAQMAEPQREHVVDPPASWGFLKIFLVILCLIGVVAISLGAYFFYVKREDSKKRFY